MASNLELPTWLAGILAVGLPVAGWFGRHFFERRWARVDRRFLRVETNLEDQRKLLLTLNGELYQQWAWLANHPDANDRSHAEPVANEIGTWLYKYSAYFPEPVRVTMVNLGHLTFHLATEKRPDVLQHREALLPAMWENLRSYQRKIERKLGLDE